MEAFGREAEAVQEDAMLEIDRREDKGERGRGPVVRPAIEFANKNWQYERVQVRNVV